MPRFAAKLITSGGALLEADELAAAYKAHKEGTAGNIVAVGKKRKAGE